MSGALVDTAERKSIVRVVRSAPVEYKKIYTSKVSANGQITVPKEVREKYGWQPGDTLVFTPQQDGFAIHKRASLREEMVGWRKSLSQETDEMIKKTAGWTLKQYHEYFDSLPENITEMEEKYGFKKA